MNSTNVELWDTADVQAWLSSIGLGAYEKKFKGTPSPRCRLINMAFASSRSHSV